MPTRPQTSEAPVVGPVAARTAPRPDTRAAARHVLLIEDDPRITSALAIRLTACGYRVGHAADLDEAVERVIDDRPDVAVLDINLPDGNGLDLADRMRRLRITVHVPMILITASRDPRYRERAAEMGVPLIEKPFPATDLIEAIERVTSVRAA